MTPKLPRVCPSASRSRRTPAAPARPAGERWAFCVLCEAHVPGRYTLEVVDLLQTPARARTDGIVAIPTAPQPRRTVGGDLADLTRATAGLQLSA
jgi:hypothetical protein